MAQVAMDATDGLLLNALQESFPLVQRPFRDIGGRLGLSEEETLERTIRLRRAQVIRQVSAIFDTRALGYRSSLVAFKTPPERILDAARVINRHPGVSHNYERNHAYNIWFTVAVPPDADPEEDVRVLADESASTYRMLPTIILYKIGVKLDMTGTMPATATSEDRGFRRKIEHRDVRLTAMEKAFVRVMQQNIAYVAEPFAGPARELGVAQPELFEIAADLQSRQIMRRFAAILRHQTAGYSVNAMGVWVVPADQTDRVGDIMAAFRNVSHCYRRPTYRDWPYSIFTMIHGRSRDDCEAVARAIQEETGIRDYEMLYSLREFKKVRLLYYTDAYEEWTQRHKQPALAGAHTDMPDGG
jgi:DNA-binding Lrp family transcriptional regulator